MKDGSLWKGGAPGRFRLLYRQSDNWYYGVAVHLSSDPAKSDEMDVSGMPSATKRDDIDAEGNDSDSTDSAQLEGLEGSTSMRIAARYADA